MFLNAAQQVYLAPICQNLAKQRLQIIQNNTVMLQQHFTWSYENFSEKNNETFIAFSERNWKRKLGYYFAILRKSNHQKSTIYLGEIAIDAIYLNRKSANVNYWVGREAQGKGVATQALCLLKEWAQNNTDLKVLEINVEVDNIASNKTATNAGARYINARKNCRLGIGRINTVYLYELELT